jgi:TPR repeat protein
MKGTDLDNSIWLVLQSGNGIRLDKSLAAHYFKLDADQGFDERSSAQEVESMRAERKAQAQGNPEPGIPALKRAADEGECAAQVGHALSLLRGDGIPMNTPAAAHYFRFGADQGNAIAQFNSGICVALLCFALGMAFHRIAWQLILIFNWQRISDIPARRPVMACVFSGVMALS